jgi:hypothetical protein
MEVNVGAGVEGMEFSAVDEDVTGCSYAEFVPLKEEDEEESAAGRGESLDLVNRERKEDQDDCCLVLPRFGSVASTLAFCCALSMSGGMEHQC